MVQDKLQFRSRGPVNAIHRQPVKTQGGSGGLRLGEMERDVMLAHGISSFLKEGYMDRSDRTRVVIDAEEGTMAFARQDGKDGRERSEATPGSGVDGGPPEFADVEVPYAFKLMHQELAAMGIDMKMFLDPIDEDDAYGANVDDTDEDDKDDKDDDDDDDEYDSENDDGVAEYGEVEEDANVGEEDYSGHN